MTLKLIRIERIKIIISTEIIEMNSSRNNHNDHKIKNEKYDVSDDEMVVEITQMMAIMAKIIYVDSVTNKIIYGNIEEIY